MKRRFSFNGTKILRYERMLEKFGDYKPESELNFW